jgi:hypothetical protein
MRWQRWRSICDADTTCAARCTVPGLPAIGTGPLGGPYCLRRESGHLPGVQIHGVGSICESILQAIAERGLERAQSPRGMDRQSHRDEEP